jgi:hypothetical protein
VGSDGVHGARVTPTLDSPLHNHALSTSFYGYGVENLNSDGHFPPQRTLPAFLSSQFCILNFSYTSKFLLYNIM